MSGATAFGDGTGCGLRIEATGDALGAQAWGVDLRARLDGDDRRRLLAALDEHLVVFFRDQALDDSGHVRLARDLGRPLPHPIARLRGERETVTVVRNDAVRRPTNAAWHSDLSWLEVPPGLAILRAVQIPPTGGDTVWADMFAAWDTLPEGLRERVEGRFAIHDFDRAVGRRLRRLDGRSGHERVRAAFPPARHPIARRHPRSGRTALFVDEAFTSEIEGVSADESRELLDALGAHVRGGSWKIRHRWREGDVVIWDERSTQHFAHADHYPAEREVRRVTLVGEATV